MTRKYVSLNASPVSLVLLKAIAEKTNEKKYVIIDKAIEMLARQEGVDVDRIKKECQDEY